jgi:PAS domain S-box-containing protein
MTSNEVQGLIHELQVHQIELELQNEELRQTQVELAHSRDQYSDLYEFAPMGYVTLDSNGKIQNANLTTAALLGVDRQHLLQARLSDFVNRESQDEFYLHRRAVLSSETRQTCEVRMEGADARGLAIRLESIAFGPEHDRRCRTALIDITEHKVAEETLRLLNIELGTSLADRAGELQQNIKQVKLFTEAVSHLGEGVLITSDKLDWPGPHIVFVNNALCQTTGYTAEELIGQSPRIL